MFKKSCGTFIDKSNVDPFGDKEKESTQDIELSCPFCGEEGFDKIGLKHHLTFNCEEWNKTKSIPKLF